MLSPLAAQANSQPAIDVDGLGQITATTTLTAAIINTTETALYTYSFPRNTLSPVGLAYLGMFSGRWTRSAVGPSIRLRLRIGGIAGTVIFDTGVIVAAASVRTDLTIKWEFMLTMRSATTMWASGWSLDSAAAASLALRSLNSTGAGVALAQVAATTINPAIANDLVWSVEFDANTADNTVSIDNALILKTA